MVFHDLFLSDAFKILRTHLKTVPTCTFKEEKIRVINRETNEELRAINGSRPFSALGSPWFFVFVQLFCKMQMLGKAGL